MGFTELTDSLSDIAFAVFAEPATVNETAVAGLFTDAIVGGETMDKANPVGTQTQAVLELQPSALSFTPEVGDTVRARGTEFTIVDIVHDACGNFRLILHR